MLVTSQQHLHQDQLLHRAEPPVLQRTHAQLFPILPRYVVDLYRPGLCEPSCAYQRHLRLFMPRLARRVHRFLVSTLVRCTNDTPCGTESAYASGRRARDGERAPGGQYGVPQG